MNLLLSDVARPPGAGFAGVPFRADIERQAATEEPRHYRVEVRVAGLTGFGSTTENFYWSATR